MTPARKPAAVFWFPNGQAAVTDGHEQLAEFQGRHEDTLRAFKAAGIDWRTLPERHGRPNCPEDTI